MTITQIKNKIRQKLNRFQIIRDENRHHQIHEKAAWNSINKAIAFNGWELTDEMKQSADDYAVRVFGGKEYAPWLYFFSLCQGGFKEGWIPLNFYSKYVLPDASLVRVSSVKTFSNVVFKTEAFPDVGYYLYGKFYNRDFSPLTFEEFKRKVARSFEKIFVKEDNSLRGMHIHIFDCEELSEEDFEPLGNCVIQYPVEQHQFFSDVISGPTAAIRVITVRNLRGAIEHRASYLKFGRIGHQWYKTTAGIWVAVIDDVGRLSSSCFGSGYQKFNAHPDTQVGFEAKIVPSHKEVVELSIRLHRTVPHFPIIGWDIAVDCDGNPIVLEWNAGAPHPDIRFSEASIGPCFTGLGWENLKK